LVSGRSALYYTIGCLIEVIGFQGGVECCPFH
jgi:hypothetical protein